jgi:hypothetical protein
LGPDAPPGSVAHDHAFGPVGLDRAGAPALRIAQDLAPAGLDLDGARPPPLRIALNKRLGPSSATRKKNLPRITGSEKLANGASRFPPCRENAAQR